MREQGKDEERIQENWEGKSCRRWWRIVGQTSPFSFDPSLPWVVCVGEWGRTGERQHLVLAQGPSFGLLPCGRCLALYHPDTWTKG